MTDLLDAVDRLTLPQQNHLAQIGDDTQTANSRRSS